MISRYPSNRCKRHKKVSGKTYVIAYITNSKQLILQMMYHSHHTQVNNTQIDLHEANITQADILTII